MERGGKKEKRKYDVSFEIENTQHIIFFFFSEGFHFRLCEDSI